MHQHRTIKIRKFIYACVLRLVQPCFASGLWHFLRNTSSLGWSQALKGMDWLRKTPAAPDEPEDAAKNHGNTVKKIERSQASEQTWTQQGNARILKILRARGFPAVEMVPMLVELQAGRYSASHNSTKAWNPVTGKFDAPFRDANSPASAYIIRIARLTKWTFDVDLDDGSVAEAMTSEEVPESEVNCVPESREERFRRVVHRFTTCGHNGAASYRVPKVAAGSPESKLPLVLESRTTPAGGSLLLMPRSTLHALFGGGPFNLCEHAIADFRKTQRPGWKPTSTASKSIIPMLVLPGLCSIAYTLLLWLVSQHSSFSSSFEAVDLVDRLPGALAVMVAAHYFCMSMIGQSGDSILQHVSLKDPLGFSAGSVTECQVFRREKHRIGDSEDPEAMQKLLQSMGMGSPVLLAAGSGTVLKPQGKAHSPAAVAKLDKYWSTVLILALWSPDFQKALCNEGNGLFQWRTKGNQGLQYGPISGARLLHCGILVLGRAIIIPRENCTMLYRTTIEGKEQQVHHKEQAHDDIFWINSLKDILSMKVGGDS